jgi:hypothetical protein
MHVPISRNSPNFNAASFVVMYEDKLGTIRAAPKLTRLMNVPVPLFVLMKWWARL